MEFIVQLLDLIVLKPTSTLTEVSTEAYQSTLSQFHGMIVRQVRDDLCLGSCTSDLHRLIYHASGTTTAGREGGVPCRADPRKFHR